MPVSVPPLPHDDKSVTAALKARPDAGVRSPSSAAGVAASLSGRKAKRLRRRVYLPALHHGSEVTPRPRVGERPLLGTTPCHTVSHKAAEKRSDDPPPPPQACTVSLVTIDSPPFPSTQTEPGARPVWFADKCRNPTIRCDQAGGGRLRAPTDNTGDSTVLLVGRQRYGGGDGDPTGSVGGGGLDHILSSQDCTRGGPGLVWGGSPQEKI